MTGVLWWNKPPKIMSRQEWESISADGAPPGVYVPNMSSEDQYRWRARLAGQRSEGLRELRAEIRRTFSSKGAGERWATFAQVLILVYADGEVRMSANGPVALTPQDWDDLGTAVAEAREAISRYQDEKKKGKR